MIEVIEVVAPPRVEHVPLQSIAMGLVILLLNVPAAGGYDVLADPLGWLLVLVGTARLETTERRGLLLSLAGLAGAVSLALWLPGVREPLVGGDAALTWAVNLPQVGYTALLAWELHGHARAADAHVPANWLRTATVVLVLAGLSPAVVFGGGLDDLAAAAYIAAGMALVLLIVLLFCYSKATWVPPRHHRPAAG